MNAGTVKVGIIGASGYTGVELLRLCAGHPELQVIYATGDTQAGTRAGELYPSVAAAYPDLVFAPYDPDDAAGLDVAFCALPHGQSQRIVPEMRGKVGHIVDLAADFRLRDARLYPTWYGEEHTAPALLAEAAFGLPELFREDLKGATLVAAAGCYPTAAALALAPFLRAGAIEPTGIIVDAASGVSGAGRGLKATTQFNTVDEDFTAYGLLTHRHTPEIEQAIGAEVLFTPHLAPMNRGILATCYARPAGGNVGTTAAALALLARRYAGEPFIVVSEASPSTKATLGSNCAHLSARVDQRTGWLVVLCALDNLVKGASGQAVQCANLALGLPEAMGLPTVGLYP
ncbi:MAG TPA: N-acetyl-gamma-glutamyl-phosphate reductase [Acidimicrobiales bacterium]|nr:N-acetyl-gamma-glutamyl-phosphate reductase [Acidimicrobiales bacterium]